MNHDAIQFALQVEAIAMEFFDWNLLILIVFEMSVSLS